MQCVESLLQCAGSITQHGNHMVTLLQMGKERNENKKDEEGKRVIMLER